MAAPWQVMRRPRLWVTAASTLALAASVTLLVVPSYEGDCIGVADYADGQAHCPRGVSHTTLVEENGPGVLWLLAAPVALTALALALPRRAVRITIAGALGIFSLVTGFTIGGAYLPATLAMALAARRTPAERTALTDTARS